MIAFVIKRLIWLVITVFVICAASFYLVRKAPGNPFEQEMRNVDAAVKAELEREYNLDKPLVVQFFKWFGKALTGDFGRSMKYRDKTVREILDQSLPVSFALGSLSLLFAVFIGLTTGLIAGARQNTAWVSSPLWSTVSVPESLPASIFSNTSRSATSTPSVPWIATSLLSQNTETPVFLSLR